MTRVYHSWEYTQRTVSSTPEVLAAPCLLLHSRQEPGENQQCIKQMWCVYTVEFYVTVIKIEIMTLFRKIDRTGNHVKQNEPDSETRRTFFSYMWNLDLKLCVCLCLYMCVYMCVYRS